MSSPTLERATQAFVKYIISQRESAMIVNYWGRSVIYLPCASAIHVGTVFVEFRGQFAVTAKVATKTPLRRTFLLVLPDCPHVGKSMKAAFSNWWLKYNGERINLALIRTLRNRSNKETKATLRKLTPKNDHVKNKDRQDPSSVLTLCNTKLTTELKDVSYVCHTIISELDRYSPDTQLGMFPKPISIAIPSSGWIAFLSYDVKSSLSTLYKARLHSAVKKISAIR